MRTGKGQGPGNAGFTYMGLLLIILIIGITTSALGRSWKLYAREEKEKELLWRGHQFRLAIERYYNSPKHRGVYPSSLDDLLKDPAYFHTVRYLRKIYK
ncbi:MAG: type II secretion system protein, partial [Nitrospirota bacterium]